MEPTVKGRITIRFAAVFFILSALFELFSVTGDVPLFGAIRSDTAALIYHLIFVAVFLAAGIGMWSAKPWGYWAVMGGTVLYTLDKVQFLLARETFEATVMSALATRPEIFQLIPKEDIIRMVATMYVVFALCALGFALYIHWRRVYFAQGASRTTDA